MSRSEATAGRNPTETIHSNTPIRIAIEAAFDDLRRDAQLLAWKSGIARTGAEVLDLADEVLQEAFVRALAKEEAFDPARSVRPWLLAFVANVLHERQRNRRRELARTAVLPNDDQSGGVAPVLVEFFDLLSHDGESLLSLLELVDPTDRQVLVLRFVDGLNGREMAAALGVKEGTARVRLARAVERMRVAYHRSGRASMEDQ